MQKIILILHIVLSVSCGGGGSSSSSPSTTGTTEPAITGVGCGNGEVETYLTRESELHALLQHEERCDDGNLVCGDSCPNDCDELVTIVEEGIL